MATISTKKMMK